MLGSVETSASIIWVSWWLAPNVYFRERTLGERRLGGEESKRGTVMLGITRHNTSQHSSVQPSRIVTSVWSWRSQHVVLLPPGREPRMAH